jgi:hypothetical protein
LGIFEGIVLSVERHSELTVDTENSELSEASEISVMSFPQRVFFDRSILMRFLSISDYSSQAIWSSVMAEAGRQS